MNPYLADLGLTEEQLEKHAQECPVSEHLRGGAWEAAVRIGQAVLAHELTLLEVVPRLRELKAADESVRIVMEEGAREL